MGATKADTAQLTIWWSAVSSEASSDSVVECSAQWVSEVSSDSVVECAVSGK